MDLKIKNSLIFEKNGEEFVRWPINPEDTKWHLEVKDFLEKNYVDSTPKKFFDAYLTASRSMILFNPKNGATFSLKVSTNNTGGKWSDKKQTWKDAEQIRKMNKYVKNTLPLIETENLIILDEPLAMGIDDIDQAMVTRSLNDLPNETHYYLPVFSILHETEGLRIAKLNGEADPVKFWKKHLVEPLANAMAVYFSATGAWHDSPHAQNFLVELDLNMKPTGRIIFKDLGDSYLLEEFLQTTDFKWIMKNWEKDRVFKGKIQTGIGFLHGNEKPSWLTGLEYKEYGWDFYNFFEKKFSELSGIPLSELSSVQSKDILFSYSRKSYPTVSQGWVNFILYSSCLKKGVVKIPSGEKCPDFYLQHKVKEKNNCFKAANEIINP
jgi:hypothetical protein